MNYYILQLLILQLQNKITGSTLTRIISPSKNIFYIIFEKEETEYCIEYYTGTNNSYIFLKENFSIPSKNISNLITEVNDSLINNISIKNNDKLIELDLENSLTLLISFINLKENIFLLKNDIIINSLKHSKELEGKSIDDYLPALDKGSQNKNVTSLKDYFRATVPKMGNEVFQSVLEEIGVTQGMELSTDLKCRFDTEIEKYNSFINKPSFGLYAGQDKIIPSLFPLKEPPFQLIKKFEDVNSLIASYSHEMYKRGIFKDVKDKKEKELAKKIQSIDKSIKSMEMQMESSLNSIKYKHAGDSILSEISSIKPGAAEHLYYNEKGEEEKIKLKTELSASENAQFYYEKYKKQRASAGTLKAKLEKMQKEKSSVEQELEELKNVTEIKKLKKMDKNLKRDEADETSRFRKFVISSGAEVWVGKDSASNDLLTTRYSAQNDLWFHVRGSSGSHTVLKLTDKNSDPSSELIKIAASIAAYYSKARNAGTVPVAFTERKYVKKKKGFKEGSVVMEREKVVMVKPKLPEQ